MTGSADGSSASASRREGGNAAYAARRARMAGTRGARGPVVHQRLLPAVGGERPRQRRMPADPEAPRPVGPVVARVATPMRGPITTPACGIAVARPLAPPATARARSSGRGRRASGRWPAPAQPARAGSQPLGTRGRSRGASHGLEPATGSSARMSTAPASPAGCGDDVEAMVEAVDEVHVGVAGGPNMGAVRRRRPARAWLARSSRPVVRLDLHDASDAPLARVRHARRACPAGHARPRARVARTRHAGAASGALVPGGPRSGPRSRRGVASGTRHDELRRRLRLRPSPRGPRSAGAGPGCVPSSGMMVSDERVADAASRAATRYTSRVQSGPTTAKPRDAAVGRREDAR